MSQENMEQRKAFRYRLAPHAQQQSLLVNFAGCSRFVFNWGLTLCQAAYEKTKKTLSYAQLCKELTLLKRTPDTLWLAGVHSQVLQQSLKDLNFAYHHFFRRVKNGGTPGFPRYKKKGLQNSFRFVQGIKVTNGKVYLPCIGWVTYFDSRPIEGVIKQVTIKQEGKHWFVIFSCIIKVEQPRTVFDYSTNIGIDLGINRLATLSNGMIIENPRHLQKKEKKLQKTQRSLSRKVKGSKNRKKQIQKVAQCHIDIRNCRNDYLQKATTTLVKNHDCIVVEDLNITGMVKNHVLAKSISDVSWGMFCSMLTYKMAWQGKQLIKINRFEPSSKKCSACGRLQDMPLKERTYRCICGLVMDRDLNASINIKAAGHAVLGERSHLSLNACGGMSIGSPNEARIPRL